MLSQQKNSDNWVSPTVKTFNADDALDRFVNAGEQYSYFPHIIKLAFSAKRITRTFC